MNCPSCGFANTAAARFCGGCGHALQAATSAAPEAERRHLCVLFCDLVGSTLRSQRMDPEDLRELVDAYQRACGKVVLRHDGYVAQYLGDGILVYFGYPHAHEDDPSRAIRCALEMVEAVGQLASETTVNLQVRIGIHSGRVVIGNLGGSGRSERLAVGDAPNIAARVQGEAAESEIVISDALQRLLPGTFTVEPMGARTLKGIDRPVELFRVVSTGGQATGLNAPPTPFVGRTIERGRVRDIWRRAVSGSPQFALLRGEPGIGKSRLLDVIREEISSDGADVLAARCTPFTTDTAFHPFIEMIGSRLGFEAASAEERVARLANRLKELGLVPEEAVPLLSSVLSIPVDPAVWPAPGLSPVRARQRTMDILIEAFQALARLNPALLIVEDLHWADPSTVELLRQLIGSARSATLMALLTARPEFQPTWAAATNVTAVDLEALAPEEAETVIRRVARDKPLPPEVTRQIRERAAGNPLFLEEVTRSLLDSGAFAEREHSWELVGELASDAVPVSIEASLMARIDRLGEARSLLQLGATVGREFSYELLTAVAQKSEDTVRRELDVMVASGLVFQHGVESPVYTFKHALVRDAAYDSLLRSTRQRYHVQIAEVLVEQFPAVEKNRPELLAHHLLGAGDFARAFPYWRTAGERALHHAANREAIAHLEAALRCLQLMPSCDDRNRGELTIQLSLMAATMAIFGWADERTERCCRRAIELSTRLSDHQTLFGASWGLWTVHFLRCELDLAAVPAEQVLAMANATGLPFMQPPARHAMGYTEYCLGRYKSAQGHGRRCQDVASVDVEKALVEAFQFPPTTACLSYLAQCSFLTGDPAHRQIIEQAFELCAQLNHLPSDAYLLGANVYYFHMIGDFERVREIAPRLARLSRDEGFAAWIPVAEIFLGWLDAIGGNRDGVDRMRMAIQSKSGTRNLYTVDHLLLAEGLVACGDEEGALAALEEAERFWRDTRLALMVPDVFRLRGEILVRQSHFGAALESFDRALDVARSHEAHSLYLRAATSRYRMLLSVGREAEGRVGLEHALATVPEHFDSVDTRRAHALLSGKERREEHQSPGAVSSRPAPGC